MRLRPDPEFAESLDNLLHASNARETFAPFMCNWSRTVRCAIGLPVLSLAERLGISQAAATKLEQHEAVATISIGKLQAVADALGCDLVYGFVPRQSLASVAEEIEAQQTKARKGKRKIPRPR